VGPSRKRTLGAKPLAGGRDGHSSALGDVEGFDVLFDVGQQLAKVDTIIAHEHIGEPVFSMGIVAWSRTTR
jgi:hypothetical protein